MLGNDGVTEKEVRDLLGLVGQEAVYRLYAAVAESDGAAGLAVLEEQMALGKDARQLLIELAGYCRSLMLFRASPNLDSPVLSAYGRDRLDADSRRLSHAQLVRLVELFYEAANNSRWSVDPRITAEMALLTACTPETPVAMVEPAVRPDSRPQTPARPQPAVAPATSPPKPAPHAADSASPPSAAITAKMPATPAVARPEPSAPAASAAALTEQDLERAMEELLRKVEQAGKRSVKELLKDATLAGYSDGVATLLFQREMIRERVEKDDIRKWLEGLLAQIVGASIRLHCTTERGRSRSPVRPAAPAAEEIPEAVLRLQKLFGGKITKIEEEQS